MARSKGDGERVPLKQIHRCEIRHGDDDWREIEKIAKIKLTAQARERIHLLVTAYSWFGPLYSPKRSVLSKNAKLAIEAWLSSTEKLAAALGPPGMDWEEFLPRIDDKLFARMNKGLTPIGQVAVMSLVAKATAVLVARFIQIEGYRCLSLMRAAGVVKCQLALA